MYGDKGFSAIGNAYISVYVPSVLVIQELVLNLILGIQEMPSSAVSNFGLEVESHLLMYLLSHLSILYASLFVALSV